MEPQVWTNTADVRSEAIHIRIVIEYYPERMYVIHTDKNDLYYNTRYLNLNT